MCQLYQKKKKVYAGCSTFNVIFLLSTKKGKCNSLYLFLLAPDSRWLLGRWGKFMVQTHFHGAVENALHWARSGKTWIWDSALPLARQDLDQTTFLLLSSLPITWGKYPRQCFMLLRELASHTTKSFICSSLGLLKNNQQSECLVTILNYKKKTTTALL